MEQNECWERQWNSPMWKVKLYIVRNKDHSQNDDGKRDTRILSDISAANVIAVQNINAFVTVWHSHPVWLTPGRRHFSCIYLENVFSWNLEGFRIQRPPQIPLVNLLSTLRLDLSIIFVVLRWHIPSTPKAYKSILIKSLHFLFLTRKTDFNSSLFFNVLPQRKLILQQMLCQWKRPNKNDEFLAFYCRIVQTEWNSAIWTLFIWDFYLIVTQGNCHIVWHWASHCVRTRNYPQQTLEYLFKNELE